MEGLQILVAAAAVVGVILAAVSFFLQAKDGRTEPDSYPGAERAIAAVGVSVGEADNAAEELHKLAGSVIGEIENKYQELLFLYNLIDEKKKELYAEYGSMNAAKEKAPKKILKHPKQQEIIKLAGEGAAVREIAKRLGMGQGEVSLILELGSR